MKLSSFLEKITLAPKAKKDMNYNDNVAMDLPGGSTRGGKVAAPAGVPTVTYAIGVLPFRER